MQQVPSFTPSIRQRGKAEKRGLAGSHLVRTFTGDLQLRAQDGDSIKPKRDTRPSHKRTLSETSPSYSSFSTSGLEHLYSPQHSTLSRERPSSPTTDEDMSESEQMIWTIIRQRVSNADFVVEEREEEEESDSEKRPAKEPLHKLQRVLEDYIQQKAQEELTEDQRRKEVKAQLLRLLATAQDEEKLSQRQTPQMSALLSEALRSSYNSNATITGPGGSFHLQDVFTSESSEDCSEFLQPRNNADVVRLALESICLPGDLCRKQREEALDALQRLGRGRQVLILLTNSFPMNQFSGLYALDGHSLRRFFSALFDPAVIEEAQVDTCFAYDSGDFMEVRNVAEADAIRLKPYCRA